VITPIIDAFSAFATACGVIFGLIRYFRARDDADLREWQKVAIHEILQKERGKWRTFDDLLKDYRSEASARDHLKKKELSRDVLRRILVELLSAGVIKQDRSDKYAIWDDTADLEKPAKQKVAANVG
jgi:hypothetical protein